MADIKTWANGQKVTPADMKRYVSDVIRGFLEPPACRRTVANMASEQKAADTWHVVKFDKPGMGGGKPHSYDNTGSLMSKEDTKIHAPIDGLYEVAFTLVARSVGSSLPFCVAAVNKNQTAGNTIAATAFLRIGLGRASTVEKIGSGSATIKMKAGEFVSLAVAPTSPMCLGDGTYAQMISHMELRWVGVG
ncbi:hypothetical protein ABWK57_14000 [Streptomyces sp. NPDC094045]|uniref:hypothetical protein n=1 Tax=unclassified Streptomyces TaxID=2593676 RepID=UPI0033988C5C